LSSLIRLSTTLLELIRQELQKNSVDLNDIVAANGITSVSVILFLLLLFESLKFFYYLEKHIEKNTVFAFFLFQKNEIAMKW